MLLALADNANDQGVCWPSMELLGRKCAIKTTRGARKVVARLKAEGFVRRQEQSGKVTRYRLSSTRLTTGDETPERTDRGGGACCFYRPVMRWEGYDPACISSGIRPLEL